MKSGSFNIAILSFFLSVWAIFSSYKKSAPKETDFNLFWTFAVILAKNAVSTSSDFFSAQNMGHKQLKTCSKYHLVGFLNEKQLSTFAHFLYISKPYWPP